MKELEPTPQHFLYGLLMFLTGCWSDAKQLNGSEISDVHQIQANVINSIAAEIKNNQSIQKAEWPAEDPGKKQ